MIEKLLDKYLPRKEMYLNDTMYLKRWYLGEFLGRTYLLHKFCSQDQDRYLHSHPWPAWSIILWGSYIERQAIHYCCKEGPIVEERRVRWFNNIPGTVLHQIVRLCNENVWTLFSTGDKLAKWGFLEKQRTHWPDGDNGPSYIDRWQYVPYDERPQEAGAKVKVYGTCPWWQGE